MKLSEILSIYSDFLMGEFASKDVKSICIDSRAVEPGSIFIAVLGNIVDGHDFIPTAIEKGAIGIVCQSSEKIPENYNGAVVIVEDSRLAAADIASKFYNNPASELFCIGVTGTNGKTSITYMIEHILNEFGWPTGVLGTIDHHLNDKVWVSKLTSPDAVTLQRRIKEMSALEAKSVVFEISSHAISQKRADGIPLDVAIFTNLTRDHLDYHSTTEEYFKAKERLFSHLLPDSTKPVKTAVINTDDSFGKMIQVGPGVKLKSYGTNAGVDYQIFIDEMSFLGTQYSIKTVNTEITGFLPMIGQFFVFNAVAAIAACIEAGVSLESAVHSLKTFNGVPGRLQRVENERGIHVFVDYAHTEDALASVLQSIKAVKTQIQSPGRIITVFGCGGDRDKGKRPQMMKAAEIYSDLVYVTSDNPRSEKPQQIINDIIVEVPTQLMNNKVFTEADRSEAIRCAINMAKPEDVIIIAGKGHEDYQILENETIHFDDVEVAKEHLKK